MAPPPKNDIIGKDEKVRGRERDRNYLFLLLSPDEEKKSMTAPFLNPDAIFLRLHEDDSLRVSHNTTTKGKVI